MVNNIKQKIVIDGDTIYEVDNNGKVLIDKRLESALENGDPDFIDEYGLPPVEERAVIEVLKKHNALYIGLNPEEAKEEADRIRKELHPFNTDSEISYLKVNNQRVYRTDSRGDIVYDNRVDDAVRDAAIALTTGNSIDKVFDEYELTPRERSIVKEEFSKYLSTHPFVTEEDKENFINDLPNIINNINSKIVNEKPIQENATKIKEKKITNDINTNNITKGEEDLSKLTSLKDISKYKDFLNKLEIPTKDSSNETKDNKIDFDKEYQNYIHKYGNTDNTPVKKTVKPNPLPSFVEDKDDRSYKDPLFLEPRNKAIVADDDVPVNDNSWITDVFMLGKKDLDTVVKNAMFWTTAELKVTDTSLGGNISINNLPQFTRTADIRVMGMRNDREPVLIETVTGNHGMGRYYSEKIDDNNVRCFLQFGVPEFNGIFNFLTSSIDYKSAVVANSGRSPLAYDIGHIVGSFAFFAAFPVISLVYWIGSEIKDLVVGPGNFQYYYLKETMPKYWSIVNSLVMMMSTELGLILPSLETNKDSNTVGTPLKLTPTDLEYMHMFMPELITKEGYIDVFAVVTKTQRAVNKYLKKQYETIKTDASIETLQDLLREAENSKIDKPTPYHEYWEDVKKAYSGPPYRQTESSKSNTNGGQINGKPTYEKDGTVSKKIANFIQNTESYLNSFIEATKATMDGGGEYAVFNVEYLGSSSMSVSNEVGDLELEGILKGVGGKTRAIRFSGGASILGSLGKIAGYATDVAVGALDGVTLNMTGKLLTMLLGDANLDLPLRWMDSHVTLPTHTFKMKLISPYGNAMSQLINIYIPLASIMAGALPLATGMSSYTSPFLCNMFVRGYQRITMGMITSLEITKGTSNLPFNKTWKPMAIDVTFTVTDFSKILALPVGQDLTSMANIIYDDNNPLNRYIQALCGRDLYTTTFTLPKFKLRLSRIIDSISVYSKPAYKGMVLGDTLRWVGYLSPFHVELPQYSNTY